MDGDPLEWFAECELLSFKYFKQLWAGEAVATVGREVRKAGGPLVDERRSTVVGLGLI